MPILSNRPKAVAPENAHSEPLTYRPEELPAMLSLSLSMTYKMLRDGRIRSVRAGVRYIIPREAVTEFLTSGEQPAAKAQE